MGDPSRVRMTGPAQGRGGDGLADPADRAAMLGQDGVLHPETRPGAVADLGAEITGRPGDEPGGRTPQVQCLHGYGVLSSWRASRAISRSSRAVITTVRTVAPAVAMSRSSRT